MITCNHSLFTLALDVMMAAVNGNDYILTVNTVNGE